ncbi:MAG: dTMP kinase [Pseudomonadota bacterium]
MGLFIVFEGIEGCGKTTQIKLLSGYFEKRNLPCLLTREPGGTPVSEEIRKIFLHSEHNEITPLTELLLVTAARVQHIQQVIQPALDAGTIVVCDRFFDATVAYQGYAGRISLDLIYRSHELFCTALYPDLTLLLDCPVEIGLARSRSRNRAAGREKEEGRFEDKALPFHEKVRQGYLELAKKESRRFSIMHAEQPAEALHTAICEVMTQKLREHGYAA